MLKSDNFTQPETKFSSIRSPTTLKRLLSTQTQPKRSDDKKKDFWNTFNRPRLRQNNTWNHLSAILRNILSDISCGLYQMEKLTSEPKYTLRKSKELRKMDTRLRLRLPLMRKREYEDGVSSQADKKLFWHCALS